MSTAWRFLFETLQFQLLSPLRLGPLDESHGLTAAESTELASAGLMQAAKVLQAAEEAGHPEREVMWRFWNDLKPDDGRRGSTRSGLEELHPKLTIVILAQFLSRVGRLPDAESPDRARPPSLPGLAARVANLPSEREFVAAVASLMDDPNEETSWTERLWEEMARERLPERQVVVVEGLQTGVLRLVAFWMLARGPIRSYLGDWLRNVQRDQFQQLVEEVVSLGESASMTFAAGSTQMMAAFDSIKPEAERRFADEMSQAPIDDVRLAELRAGFEDRWRSENRLREIVAMAGGAAVEDADRDKSSSRTTARAYLVADTNYLGAKWTGESIAEDILHFEVLTILRNWADSADTAEDIHLLQGLSEVFAEWEHPAMFRSIDYAGDIWFEENLENLAELQIPMYTTTALADDMILVVDASPQTWHISSRANPTDITIQDVPLRDGDEAKVEVVFSYAVPLASGAARVRHFRPPWPIF